MNKAIITYLKLLILFLMIFSGCKQDDGLTSPSPFNQLIGTWENEAGENEYWKYLILTSDNFYHRMSSSENNKHELTSGIYSVNGSQIKLSRNDLYVFEVKNDTLTLSQPGRTVVFVRTNSAPDKDTWVMRLEILKEVPFPYIRDITYDGSCFWASTHSDSVIKIDSLGNVLREYRILNSGGIAYGNDRLWIANRDTIKEVSRVNGEIISLHKIEIGSYLISLSFESGFLWGVDTYGIISKIKISTGEIVHKFNFDFLYAIACQGSKLWCIDGYSIYSIDPALGKAIETYKFKNYEYVTALAFDGKSLWAARSGVNYNSLIKLNIP